MSGKKLLHVSWDEACALCLDILVPKVGQPKGIAAVSRGGMVPAAILSYAMKIPIVFLIDPQHPRRSTGLWPPSSDLLVVDDICDTGATFRSIREFFPGATLATLYVKPAGLDACDVSAATTDQDTWVVLPWAPNDEVNR